MGYIATKDTAQSHSFIANKQINVINTKKGVVTEYIQIRIKCMFDTAKSEITQYYVKEINNNVKTKTLDKEQIVKFAPDVKLFQEKMLFYCNPEFKGR
ncbi:hypothetical protein SDC9_130191 [bioreactor metagenome]|uniref:Uncharacterized protein n=1 Tax=bioreactor metagenome TaxID=1076179 RepID=A0A645D242_9ZZZZ